MNSTDILYATAIGKFKKWYKFLYSDECNEEALELFEKAKNQYIGKKEYDKSILCYEWIITCLTELKSYDKMATIYVEYADILLNKKNNSELALKYYSKAINILIDEGKFINIAKIKTKLAQYYTDKLCLEEAITLYKEIVEIYQDSPSSLCPLKETTIKMFELQVHCGKFEDAYNSVKNLLENKKILEHTYLYNDNIFHALLCMIIVDNNNLENALEDFSKMSFDKSSQYLFLIKLNRFLQNNDLEGFTAVIQEYDSLTKLGELEIILLKKIKELFENENSIL